jgi:hypothetical protein
MRVEVGLKESRMISAIAAAVLSAAQGTDIILIERPLLAWN